MTIIEWTWNYLCKTWKVYWSPFYTRYYASYFDQYKYEEALVLYKDCAVKQQVVLGRDHKQTINTMSWLADTYMRLDKFADAEVINRSNCNFETAVVDGSVPLS